MARLKKEIKEAIAAAFSGIWINSYEHEDALAAISEACKEHTWQLITWDPEFGVRSPEDKNPTPSDDEPNPAIALHQLLKLDTEENRAILVLRNVLPYLASAEGRVGSPRFLQVLQRTIEQGAQDGHHVVILSYDNLAVPRELEKMVYIIDHDLPDAEELHDLMASVEDNEAKLPAKDSPEAKLLTDAAAGLTRLEALGAFSKSKAKHRMLKPDVLWELKAKMLQKTGLLEMLTKKTVAANDTPIGFSMLGGLNVLKGFCKNMFDSPNRSKKVRPLGVMLVGPSGTGKSAFATSLGDEIGWPTVRLDPGKLMGSLVGDTEANTRRALKTIDAMSPCVLMVDEVEKALAGSGGGAHDSGVGARLLGSLLTWMNDHTSEVFIIMTSNDITGLPPEFTRAERFDGIFFLDLPGKEQREMVWDIYTTYYAKHGLTKEMIAERPDDENWTPAEIKANCRLATLHNTTLKEASKFIVPVYKTSKEKIVALQQWATNRTLSSDYPGMYDINGPKKLVTTMEEGAPARPRRRVTRA